MLTFCRLLAITLLTSALGGCGSIMSSAGAGPIEEDPGERTFGQTNDRREYRDKSEGQYPCCRRGYDDAHVSVVSSTALS